MPCVSIQFTGVSVIIGKHEFLSRFSSRISRSISTNGLRTHLTRFRLCLFWFSCGAALLCWVCCLKLESNLVGIQPQTTICHGTWTNVTPINYPACSGPMINFPPCQQNLPKKVSEWNQDCTDYKMCIDFFMTLFKRPKMDVKKCLKLGIMQEIKCFKSQTLASFDVKIKTLFVISAILALFWKVITKFLWHGEMFFLCACLIKICDFAPNSVQFTRNANPTRNFVI